MGYSHGVSESRTQLQPKKDLESPSSTRLEALVPSRGFTDSMDMNLSRLQETVKDMEAWHARPKRKAPIPVPELRERVGWETEAEARLLGLQYREEMAPGVRVSF